MVIFRIVLIKNGINLYEVVHVFHITLMPSLDERLLQHDAQGYIT